MKLRRKVTLNGEGEKSAKRKRNTMNYSSIEGGV